MTAALALHPETTDLRRLALTIRRLEASGVDAAVRGRPAGTAGRRSASAFGERVEIVDLGARRTLIAVIDAHGPGEAARDVAAALAVHVRFAAERNYEPPTLLLASSDELVRRMARDERAGTASMLVLLIDAVHHTVRIANAAMPAPLVGGRAGLVVPLGDRGPALGLGSGVPRRESGPIRLSPGQVLLAATDGVFDAAQADGAAFGADHVAEILSSARAEGPSAVARRVLAASEAWAAPEDQDDRTAVALRLK